jgi:uncharacterized membrane protein
VDWRDGLTLLLLVLILVAGYWLRSVGRNWDDYTHLHPDERFLTDVASRVGNSPLNLPAAQAEQKARCDLRYPVPTLQDLEGLPQAERDERLARAGRGGYFDAECSDLNPNNIGFGLYVYGQFPLFSLRVGAESIVEISYAQCLRQAEDDPLLQAECLSQKRFAPQTSYNGIHLVGRAMSSLADTLTILVVFLIGLQLFGRPQALLGATLYAFAAFPIQQSHFWTVDAFTTLWATLALYAAVNILRGEYRRAAVFTPLAWIVSAFGVWILELETLDAPTIIPLVVYLAAFGLVGLGASLALDYKQRWAWGLSLLAIVGLGAALALDEISLVGAGGTLALASLLSLFTALGFNRLMAHGGSWLWLMVAFGLWVYDSLAHHTAPSLLSLVIFGIIFTAGSGLGSALYRSRERASSILWIFSLGLPVLIWGVICALFGAVSWEGMAWALLLTGLLSWATAYGYRDYAMFGVAFGAALASRVNVAPLVGVLLLAVGVQGLVLFDAATARPQRYRMASHLMAGLMIAGALTLLFFRLLQPHAFQGAVDLPLLGNLGVLPAGLNEGWVQDISEAQRLVSGQADIPPNHQWANRLPWLFPGQNIVLYGLGIALGVSAVFGLLWALWIIIRAKPGAIAVLLPALWVTAYFGWLGPNWVTSMRYFLLLYGPLTLLAAWALWEMVMRARRAMQSQSYWKGRAAFGMASTLLVFVLGYTLLYGYGMTAIYRNLLTRAAASLWFQQNVPGDLGVWVVRDDGSYALQNLATSVVSAPPTTILLDEGQSVTINLTLTDSIQVQEVVLQRLMDRDQDEDDEIVRVRFQQADPVSLAPLGLGERLLEADLSQGLTAFGDEYRVAFDENPNTPMSLPLSEVTGVALQYQIEISAIDGNIALSRNVVDNILPANPNHLTLQATNSAGDPAVLPVNLDSTTAPISPYTYYLPSQRAQISFTANATGTVELIEIPHLADPLRDADNETLRVELYDTAGNISYGGITGNFIPQRGDSPFGPQATLTLDPPMRLEAGQTYTLAAYSDAPLTTMGAVIATEGPWDDAIPYKVCPLPPGMAFDSDTPSGYSQPSCIGIELYSAHYYGLELYLAAEDDTQKRETMQRVLDQADYLTISSNRFYDSLSRIPYRWPMSMAYYEALFSGELGFELVHIWESSPRVEELGLRWRDQFVPTDDLPTWLNEFEVEEAFTVYDHPTVYVFRKTEGYDSAFTAQVLATNTRQYKEAFGGFANEATPVNRNVIIAPAANTAPTGLMLPEAMWAEQQESTWWRLYNPDSFLNRNQWAAAAAWWGLMIVLGWLAFPLLFAAFPALPDRGYSAAKLVGLMIVAWSAWFASSLHLELWNQNGLLLCMALLGAMGLAFMMGQSRTVGGTQQGRITQLRGFIRARWGYMLAVEALSLLLFVAFLYVRYRNPDLWHNAFGGEKPMDFAYFNAVLRSQTFPPLDPWFAGGFINYYYWGFVLVGTPVKLLGIVPAVAYNLAIPTMFAVTGMGAFAVAYNVAESGRLFPRSRMPQANPWLAGIAALLLVAVLGNLDTMRLFITEVAKVGGWTNAYTLTQERRDDLTEDFRSENSRDPNAEELLAIQDEAENPPVWVSGFHTVSNWRELAVGFWRGLVRIVRDDAELLMATHRWYWAPTRVIAELPDGKGHNAINEMPYFTFLYGDLHAHMMAMPLMLLVMLWLTAEILGAGRGLRGIAAGAAGLFIGGLTVGLLRATNTWDFPTFLILGLGGLTFVAWLHQRARYLEGQVTPSQTYGKLLAYMDIRRIWNLWWLILAVPVGILLHGMVWVVQWRGYQNDLEAGLIPQQCQQISELGLPAGVTMPVLCEGKIEPIWRLSESLGWGVGLFLLSIIAYWLLLVLFGERFDRPAVLGWAGRLGAFIGLAFLTSAPYAYWNVGEAGLKPWESDRTPLWAYVDIHGLFLFILVSFLVWNTLRMLRTYRVQQLKGLGVPAALVLLGVPSVLLVSLLIGLFAVPVMLITLPMLLWASGLFLLPDTSRMERFIYALIVLALGLTTGVEIVVLDVDIGRQNMVFKFYMQAWLLFGVSSGVALAWLLGAVTYWNQLWRGVWQISLALLLTIAMMYPIMATQARWLDRFDPTRTGNTLDGQAYMQYAVYGDNAVWFNLRGDYEMIQWINRHIEGTPTIIEAQTTEYKWGSRIAINTGLPTVIGWNWHQRQQRNVISLNQLVWNRSNNVAAFYNAPDIDTAWNLIQFYDIQYIILGVQERVTYNDLRQDPTTGGLQSGLSLGLAKFERMVDLGLLEVVYQAPTCVSSRPLTVEDCAAGNIVTNTIYRVRPDANYTPLQLGGG